MNTLCTQQPSALYPNTSDSERCVQSDAKGFLTRITSSAVVKALVNTKQHLMIRYKQHVSRRAIQQIDKLDDHMLKDMGITRYDVKWASRLPLSEDAAAKLEIIARRR